MFVVMGGADLVQNSSFDQNGTVPIGSRTVSFGKTEEIPPTWPAEKEAEIKSLENRIWNARLRFTEEQNEVIETVSWDYSYESP